MQGTQIGQRLFSTTRGRIVQLVRRSARTVDELAELLGLTRNAVREQLFALERDGFVHRSGVRRANGKPAQLYALTAQAAELFPRGYAPVLHGVLDALAEHFAREALQALLSDVGRKLVAGRLVPRDGVRERVFAAAELLNDLGGLAEARELNGMFAIQAWSCPLASVVLDHPEVCGVLEAMLAEIINVSVRERCDRSEPPRCYFDVTSDSQGSG